MPKKTDDVRLILEAIRAMREAGYTQEKSRTWPARPGIILKTVATSPTHFATASTAIN